MKTFIITDSWDMTSDLVIQRMKDKAFRINSDIIRDYKIALNEEGFHISDPSGRTINSSEISSVYWRKPFSEDAYSDPSHPEYFFYSECRYLIRELYNICVARGAFALVEEGAERRLGKIKQLIFAKDYFAVPEWNLHLGHDYTAPLQSIAKSLSGEAVDAEHVLYTTRIDGMALDPSHVWFTQRAVDRSANITVCFVNGSIFAYRLNEIEGITDWRAILDQPEAQEWHMHALPPTTIKSINLFMQRCGLRYGRLDFLLQGEELYFLEVNPNGQWAWLDLNDKTGLISSMVNAIRGNGTL